MMHSPESRGEDMVLGVCSRAEPLTVLGAVARLAVKGGDGDGDVMTGRIAATSADVDMAERDGRESMSAEDEEAEDEEESFEKENDADEEEEGGGSGGRSNEDTDELDGSEGRR